MSITYAKVNGADLEELVEEIEEVVEGNDPVKICMSCMIIAIMQQAPEITPQRLSDVIKSLSEYLSALLSEDQGSIN